MFVQINLTPIGDDTAGIRHMIVSYAHYCFPKDYVVEGPIRDILMGNTMARIKMWPSPGPYERLRQLGYAKTDCILLCYSIEDRVAFNNLLSDWYPKIRDYAQSVPIVLVGTKCDLRISNSEKFVSHAEGEQLKKQIGATAFIECSAKTRTNLDEVFEVAVLAGMHKRNAEEQKKSKCIML